MDDQARDHGYDNLMDWLLGDPDSYYEAVRQNAIRIVEDSLAASRERRRREAAEQKQARRNKIRRFFGLKEKK